MNFHTGAQHSRRDAPCGPRLADLEAGLAHRLVVLVLGNDGARRLRSRATAAVEAWRLALALEGRPVVEAARQVLRHDLRLSLGDTCRASRRRAGARRQHAAQRRSRAPVRLRLQDMVAERAEDLLGGVQQLDLVLLLVRLLLLELETRERERRWLNLT